MSYAKTGDWVQITKVVLPAGSRAPQVPEDTQNTDLVMWVKGFVQQDAEIGDTVEIITTTGRRECGTLCEVNPGYSHSYGHFVPELTRIQAQLRELLNFGGADDD